MYEVVDGKQRIKTIIDFYEDRFQYKGKYYSDLSKMDQYIFDNTQLLWAEISENISKNDLYKLFIKINTFGKVMDEYHLSMVKSYIKE